MRLLMDSLIALTILAVLAGVLWQTRTDYEAQTRQELTRSEVTRFQQQIRLQAVLHGGEHGERTYPASIEPGWFEGNLPVNPLLEPGHPWVEVASAQQRHLAHPPDRIASNLEMAAFWYNPHTGVIRARVPAAISDARAMELYNLVNGCQVEGIFAENGDGP